MSIELRLRESGTSHLGLSGSKELKAFFFFFNLGAFW